MYRVAAFTRDRDRGGLISISYSDWKGFIERDDTQYESLRRAVVEFLEVVRPRQFSVCEQQAGANLHRSIVVYYFTDDADGKAH